LDVAFADDGKTLVSVGRDQKVRTWDAATGKEKATFDVGQPVRALFSTGGRMVAFVGPEDTWTVWDVASAKKLRTWPRSSLHGLSAVDAVMAPRFSPDGTALAVNSGQRVELRLLNTNDETYLGHHQAVLSIAFSPDGTKAATAAADETVRLWETA